LLMKTFSGQILFRHFNHPTASWPEDSMNPPPVIREISCWQKLAPPLVFSGLLVMLFLSYFDLPRLLPRCTLKSWTGIPCPFCGGTRSLTAWSQFDPVQAFAWNPLTALACLLIAAWFLFWAGATLLKHPAHHKVLPWVRMPVAGYFLLLLLFANWVYLLLNLPR
jgi:hypothetical protein